MRSFFPWSCCGFLMLQESRRSAALGPGHLSFDWIRRDRPTVAQLRFNCGFSGRGRGKEEVVVHEECGQ